MLRVSGRKRRRGRAAWCRVFFFSPFFVGAWHLVDAHQKSSGRGLGACTLISQGCECFGAYQGRRKAGFLFFSGSAGFFQCHMYAESRSYQKCDVD